MSGKRNSATAPNIPFVRSEHTSREDKCKEFWKYLDDKKTLEPYQPPKCPSKCSEEIKPCTSSSTGGRSTPGCRSTTGSASGKGPKFSCTKGAKPKQPNKKDAQARRLSGKFSQYERSFREGVELAVYDPSAEELIEEINQFDKRMQEINPQKCPICEKIECCCTDEEDEVTDAANKNQI